jgi:hypothetical protein
MSSYWLSQERFAMPLAAEVFEFRPIASGTTQVCRAAEVGVEIFNLSRVQRLICHIGNVTIRVVL